MKKVVIIFLIFVLALLLIPNMVQKVQAIRMGHRGADNNLFLTFHYGRVEPYLRFKTETGTILPNNLVSSNQVELAVLHKIQEEETIQSIIEFYTGEVTQERYQQLVDLNKMLNNSSHSWDNETIYAGRLLLIPGSWIRINSYRPTYDGKGMGIAREY